jgi:hypothetical protein
VRGLSDLRHSGARRKAVSIGRDKNSTVHLWWKIGARPERAGLHILSVEVLELVGHKQASGFRPWLIFFYDAMQAEKLIMGDFVYSLNVLLRCDAAAA